MADYEDGGGGGGMAPCPNCGRTFNIDSLSRHAPICKKTGQKAKKRKVFDSGKQRAQGSDVPLKSTLRPGQVGKENTQRSGQKPQAPPKNNWRQKHQDFISAIRNARGVTEALKTGAPLPPPPAPSINPDYVQCQHCGRRFNQKAHGRHEPFCKEQHDRISSKPVITDQARQRAAARSMKPPRLRQKTQTDMTNGGDYGYSNTGYGNRGGSSVGRPPVGTGRGASRRDSNGSMSGAYGNMSKSQSTGQMNDQGMGRPMRTGRDPQTYQEAKSSARGMSVGRGTGSMSRGTPPSTGRMGMNNNTSAGRQGSAGGRFCHECGNKFPVATAKFCCNCGIRRLSTGGF